LFVQANGTFSDGSGSQAYYSNSANCVWMLAPPQASIITLSFTEISTQYNRDFIRVYQCSNESCSTQVKLAELSGWYSIPPTVTGATGFMKVVFTSDATTTYQGFTASWVSHFACFCFVLFCSEI
jgi:hypothetical protein